MIDNPKYYFKVYAIGLEIRFLFFNFGNEQVSKLKPSSIVACLDVLIGACVFYHYFCKNPGPDIINIGGSVIFFGLAVAYVLIADRESN